MAEKKENTAQKQDDPKKSLVLKSALEKYWDQE